MIAALLLPLALGRVGNMTLTEVARVSPLIVVADVTRIDKIAGAKVATATVQSSIKGRATEVRFIAEPTWTCDISKAVVGEHILLLLHEAPKKGSQMSTVDFEGLAGAQGPPIYRIAHSGRGRIPLQKALGGWQAGVERYDAKSPWMLQVNLLLPPKLPVKVANRTHAAVSLSAMLASVTLSAPRASSPN